MGADENGHVPSVTVRLDRDRRWQMDLPAFERACDGFDELGLTEFAENPVASIQAIAATAKAGMRMNRRTSQVLRVWLWAGLTGEDPALTLADVSRALTFGRLPKLMIEILPLLAAAIADPTGATAEPAAAGATGPLGGSASG